MHRPRSARAPQYRQTSAFVLSIILLYVLIVTLLDADLYGQTSAFLYIIFIFLVIHVK